MSRLTRLITLAAFTCAAALAQVDVPLLGYLPDAGKIRPVFGIPAAAAIASPLDLGGDFDQLAVSPNQDYILASAAGAVVVMSPAGKTTPIPNAGAAPTAIVLSPRGASAVLSFAGGRRAQIVTGLPSAPTVRDVDILPLRGAPQAFTVSDDGQSLAASGDGLFLLGPDGAWRKLPLRERSSAFAFFPGSHDLAVATRFHIFSIEDPGGAATVSSLYDGALDPAGLAAAPDNRHLLVAEKSGNVLSLDLPALSVSQFNCGCAPDNVSAMGRSLFRLTSLAGGTFKLFDAATGEMFFVPLAQPEGAQQ